MATVSQHPSTAPAIAATRLLASYDSHKLEAFIEIAIGLLDMIDGDPDLEDDDPAGGNVEDEGEMREFYRTPPKYGEDQTKGSTNGREALIDYTLDLYCPI